MRNVDLEVDGFYEGSSGHVIKILDIGVDNFSPYPLSQLAQDQMEKHVVLQTCAGSRQTRSLKSVCHWARRRLLNPPVIWPQN